MGSKKLVMMDSSFEVEIEYVKHVIYIYIEDNYMIDNELNKTTPTISTFQL